MNQSNFRFCFRFPSRQCRAGLSLLVLGALITGATSAAPSQEWYFKVFLDDRPIGYHTFRVTDRGTDRIVETEARFKVKVQPFKGA